MSPLAKGRLHAGDGSQRRDGLGPLSDQGFLSVSGGTMILVELPDCWPYEGGNLHRRLSSQGSRYGSLPGQILRHTDHPLDYMTLDGRRVDRRDFLIAAAGEVAHPEASFIIAEPCRPGGYRAVDRRGPRKANVYLSHILCHFYFPPIISFFCLLFLYIPSLSPFFFSFPPHRPKREGNTKRKQKLSPPNLNVVIPLFVPF